MSRPKVEPTGREISFGEEEIIVSKTDLRSLITYANPVFTRVAGYTEEEILGKPQNIIRHPSMPRCIFRLLWETIQGGNEIFAYILNMAKNGDGYWVFAHVTPSYNASGTMTGFHSNRRVPFPGTVDQIRPLYDQLLREEARHQDKEEAISASSKMLATTLADKGLSYAQFVFSLSPETTLKASIR